MDEMKYKAAFDSVKFSETFERDTVDYLLQDADKQKETGSFKTRKHLKTAAIAAALAVVLSASAFAAFKLLTAKDIALHVRDAALAQAFDAEDALIVNEQVQSGDYTITLIGMASGKSLSDYMRTINGHVQEDESYIAVSVAYTDGREIPREISPDMEDSIHGNMTVTPLVSGYKPWELNAWAFSGSATYFVEDGVLYFLERVPNLEIFADHTIYVAVYAWSCGYAGAPCAQLFKMDENGEISYLDGITGPHALFTLPIDPSKADPDAADALLRAMHDTATSGRVEVAIEVG